MKSSRQKRRAGALARFRVLPFNEWREKQPVAGDAQEMLDQHAEYCQRKEIERQALMKGNN